MNKKNLAILLLAIFAIVGSGTLATAATSVETGHSESNDGPLFGSPSIELYPLKEGGVCVGAKAVAWFPFKWISRSMKTELQWDAYDEDNNHYTGSLSNPTITSMGAWIIEKWVEIPNFDHGTFTAKCWEGGVLEDTDTESYTYETSSN